MYLPVQSSQNTYPDGLVTNTDRDPERVPVVQDKSCSSLAWCDSVLFDAQPKSIQCALHHDGGAGALFSARGENSTLIRRRKGKSRSTNHIYEEAASSKTKRKGKRASSLCVSS